MPHPSRAAIDAMSAECACLNVRRTARAVTQMYDRILAPTGLRATQVTLLVALERAGQPIPFTRLASVLGMDRTTLTRNVQPLQRGGLMTLRAGPDRRVRLAAMTDRGRALLLAAIPLWEKAQRRIAGELGPGRWENIRRDLHRIAELAGESDIKEGTPP